MFKKLIDTLQNASTPVEAGAETAEQIRKATSRRAKSAASKITSQEYTVQSGDSLSAIALKFYSDWHIVFLYR